MKLMENNSKVHNVLFFQQTVVLVLPPWTLCKYRLPVEKTFSFLYSWLCVKVRLCWKAEY